MRRMNSILLGHHGASGRTDCMYLSMADLNGRIVPRQRQAHDAARHGDVGRFIQLGVDLAQDRNQRFERQRAALVVDLQRAHAGGEVRDAGHVARPQLGHEAMHAEAQLEVEDDRPILDQQILVARSPIDDERFARLFGDLADDAVIGTGSGR